MQGLILIPDISGFTKFVNTINIDHGVLVTKDLLNEIINSNPFNLRLCEIEGDALLYFKIGRPILPDNLFRGLKKIYEAFTRRYQILKTKYHVTSELSLKFIIHYGNILVYDIHGFEKLFGQTVIEAHQLMKTGTDLSDYILVTNDYLQAVTAVDGDKLSANWNFDSCTSQTLAGPRAINYYFVNLISPADSEAEMQTSHMRA